MNQKNPIGIYIHIPFCLKKCKYCAFESQIASSEDISRIYIPALIKEISRFKSHGKEILSMYIGGGTPSILLWRDLEMIVNQFERFNKSKNCEITMEANPSSVTKDKAKLWHNMGINRISLGVQSFLDKDLKFLGRLHTSAQAEKSFSILRDVGFKNIAIDLLFALPLQINKGIQRSLNKVKELKPEHLSFYGLSIEAGTILHKELIKKKFNAVNEKIYAEQYLYAHKELESLGYEHYEVSSFARWGYESRHNMNYWLCGEYAGFGAASHGYLNGYRYGHIKEPLRYSASINYGGSALAFKEKITKRKEIKEWLFLGLRTKNGLLKKESMKLNHKFWSENTQLMRSLDQRGYGEFSDEHFFLSAKGFLVLDEIIRRFQI